jgi:tetratricopeptide (TPR) repeat protein
VCDLDGDLGIDVIDGLQVLLDHSLIRQEAGSDGAVRFRRLETIREYARELLVASGEEAALRRRHAMLFRDLAEHAEIYYYGPQGYTWMERLAADYDNLHTALVWSTGATGDMTIALCLVASLWNLWLNRRPLSDGYHWVETVLDRAGEGVLPELRAKALSAAGAVALFKGDNTRAERWLAEALVLYEMLGDDLQCSEVLNHLGIVKTYTAQYREALAYQEASLQRAQQAESEVRIAWTLSALSRAHTFRGDFDRAMMWIEAALALGALHGNAYHVANTVLAEALVHVGDDVRAMALLEAALPVLRDETGAVFVSWALFIRARLAQEHGDDTAAEALLREGLARAEASGTSLPLVHIHFELGRLALRCGDVQNAQAHFRESLTFGQEQQNPWLVAIVLLGAGVAALAAGEQPVAHAHYARSLALLRDWRENPLARQAALSAALAGLAVSSPLDTPTAAAQMARIWGTLAAFEPLTEGRRVTPPFLSIPSPPPMLRDAAVQTAKGLIGETAFAEAWEVGRAQTLEQAVADALGAG